MKLFKITFENDIKNFTSIKFINKIFKNSNRILI